ncbi:hypothetical protein [Archangium sp.]|uniref:hypothetical protein n=1 Tax=Archangium sp. TaxID=1872627 RepID=UPI00286B2021|nr:hypothetical protein [Archangium sp.]
MAEIMRAHHEQVREEYQAKVRSGLVPPPMPAPPARVFVRRLGALPAKRRGGGV